MKVVKLPVMTDSKNNMEMMLVISMSKTLVFQMVWFKIEVAQISSASSFSLLSLDLLATLPTIQMLTVMSLKSLLQFIMILMVMQNFVVKNQDSQNRNISTLQNLVQKLCLIFSTTECVLINAQDQLLIHLHVLKTSMLNVTHLLKLEKHSQC